MSALCKKVAIPAEPRVSTGQGYALSKYSIRVGKGCDHAQYAVAGVFVSMWRTRGNDDTHISVDRNRLSSDRNDRLSRNDGDDLLVFVSVERHHLARLVERRPY